MIWGYSVYEILWLFLIYGCLGWCVEVAYAALEKGCFVNRGFLNGPICPIYGIGAVIVIIALTPLMDNIILLFIGSAVITSLLELLTGFALDKLFHTRWWDYSDIPFNLGGYICLKFSIMWGFVCIALMKGIQPVIYGFVKLIPDFAGAPALFFLLALLIADIVVTVITINKLINRMRFMEDISRKISELSDEMGEHIYEGVAAAVKKSDDFKKRHGDEIYAIKEKGDEIRARHNEKLDELRDKYSGLLAAKPMQRRIIKAFPNMKPRRHSEQFARLKEKHASGPNK